MSSYARPFVVRCMGVGPQWVGLGLSLGCVWVDKMEPWRTLVCRVLYYILCRPLGLVFTAKQLRCRESVTAIAVAAASTIAKA